jgi:hypothetical protein
LVFLQNKQLNSLKSAEGAKDHTKRWRGSLTRVYYLVVSDDRRQSRTDKETVCLNPIQPKFTWLFGTVTFQLPKKAKVELRKGE